MPSESDLVLGWAVDSSGNPSYWLVPGSQAGGQDDDHLVMCTADRAAHHTLIVAQSGAGKSAFLGRYIEEVATKTRAKFVIIDPNADFSRINQIESEELWTSAKFDAFRQEGHLPHEASKKEFEERWADVSIRIRSARNNKFGPGADDSQSRLQVWWPDVPIDLITHEYEPLTRIQLFHAHEFLRQLWLIHRSSSKHAGTGDFVDVTQRVMESAWSEANESTKKPWEFGASSLREEIRAQIGARFSYDGSLPLHIDGVPITIARRFIDEDQFDAAVETAAAQAMNFDEQVARIYFALSSRFKIQDVLADSPPPVIQTRPTADIDVIDLPSIDDSSTQEMLVASVLSETWEDSKNAWNNAQSGPGADQRTPTFIVIDEAHNLVPKEAAGVSGTGTREFIRRIAAEGRKYGLFLILVSQRPDKLDEGVVSECENVALMRLGAQSTLDTVRTLLGLDDIGRRTIEKVLSFGRGRALLAGPWAGSDDGILLYGAARRTLEGGANLRTEYWTTPWSEHLEEDEQ